MNRTSYVRLHRPVSGRSQPKPCGLPHHTPGSRVQWSEFNTASGEVLRLRGTVLAHTNRTLTIRGGDGTELTTSCGHVGRPTR